MPVWITLVIAGASGLASAVLTAILSPLIVSGLQQKSSKRSKLRSPRSTHTRPTPWTRIYKARRNHTEGGRWPWQSDLKPWLQWTVARYLVRSFFSDAVYALYDKAMRTEISIVSTPNASFEGAREEAVLAMAEELSIRPGGRSGR